MIQTDNLKKVYRTDEVETLALGGVNLRIDAGEFVSAGAVVVGAGGSLVDKGAIEAGDYETLTRNAEELVSAVEAARE